MKIQLNLDNSKEFNPQDLSVKLQSDNTIILFDNDKPIKNISNDVPYHIFDNRKSFPAVYNNNKKELNIIRFIELNGKTSKSLLKSTVRVNQLADKVPLSVAVNELGNMYSLYDFGTMMKKQNKKPIFGAEINMFSQSKTYYVQLNDTLTIISNILKVSISDIRNDNQDVLNNIGDNDVINNIKTLNISKAKNANHLVILAKNRDGYKNLMYLVSYGQIHKEFGLPQVSWDELLSHKDGLIVLSGNEDSEIYRSLTDNDYDHAKKVITTLKDSFKDDFYVELLTKDSVHNTTETLKELADKLNVKTIISNDFYMLNKGQDDSLKALQTIGLGVTLKQNFDKINPNGYLHTSEEMEAQYKDDLVSLDNTIEIYEKIDDINVLPNKLFTPEFPLPEGFNTQNEYFEYLSHKGFDVRMQELNIDQQQNPEKYKEYEDRLLHEISVIEEMGYAGYFLIVADFINYAKRNYNAYDDNTANRWRTFAKQHNFSVNKPIAIGYGRGSAAGSLVAYSMYITEVDPLEYDLLFERFLNSSRAGMPDIDTDIPNDKRPEVVEYVTDFYNKGNKNTLSSHVAGIIVFGTLKGKQAVRDVTKIYGLPVSVGDKMSAGIAKVAKKQNKTEVLLTEALKDDDFKKLYNSSTKYQQVIDMAIKLEGLEKSESQHAAGKIITPDPVINYLPVSYLKVKGTDEYGIVAQATNVESFGLLKMDFLGLRSMGVVDKTISLINKNIKENNVKNNKHDEYLQPKTLLKNAISDINLYKFIENGHTYGIFQFGKEGITNLAKNMFKDINSLPQTKETGKEMFNRLAAATALYRPGPMQFIDTYLSSMNSNEPIKYQVPQLESVLKETYGVAVYQEQVMRITRKVAGFSLNDADNVRKAMGHKIESIMNEYKEYFINGSKEKNIPGAIKQSGLTKKEAEDLWATLQKFASYGFNKSHSIAYTFISIVDAYLSYYYPNEFYASVLNSYDGSDKADKIMEGIAKAKDRNIKILPPSVNRSYDQFSVSNNGVVFGLNAIRGIGQKATAIIDERENNGKFSSLINLIIRMKNNSAFGKSLFEQLTYSGALDEFKGTRLSKLQQEDSLLEFASQINKLQIEGKKSLMQMKTQSNLLDSLFHFRNENELDFNTKLFKEKEYTGFFVTGNPIEKFNVMIKNNKDFYKINDFNIKQAETSEEENDTPFELSSDALSEKVNIIAIIDDIKIINTKKNNSEMAILKLEDDTGTISATVFPEQYKQFKDYIVKNNIVTILGTFQNDDNYGKQIIVNGIIDPDTIFNNKNIKSVLLTLNSNKEIALEELQNVLRLNKNNYSHGKQYQLQYRIGENGKIFNRTLNIPTNDFYINLTLELSNRLQNYLGKDNVQFNW